MKEKISLDELSLTKKIEKNLFIDESNIFLQKGMTIKQNEVDLLKKWGITDFLLKENIKIATESFTSSFLFEKEKISKTYASLLGKVNNYYKAANKQYTLSLPDCKEEVEKIYKMQTEKSFYFLFYMHCYKKANTLEEIVLRSSIYALFIAKRLGKNLGECNNIFCCSIISEIGYIEKSEKTLANTIKKSLPTLDFSFLKPHTSLGFKVAVEKLMLPKDFAINILTHHDYIDGSGFNKIPKEKLSISSLIITVAQEFTYLTTNFFGDICPTFDLSNGILQLLKKKSRYDRKVLNAFISFMSFYPPGTLLYLNNQKLAFSIGAFNERLDKPKVEIVADKQGKVTTKQETIDLSKEDDKEILGIINDKRNISKIIKTIYGK